MSAHAGEAEVNAQISSTQVRTMLPTLLFVLEATVTQRPQDVAGANLSPVE
jgi:hypothetical protein